MLELHLRRRRRTARKSLARMPRLASIEGLESRCLLASGPLTMTITELGTSPLQTVTITDNGTGDSNPATGVIDYSTPASSPFADFSVTNFSATSNRVSGNGFGDIVQSGVVTRTSTTAGPETLSITVQDSGFTNPAVDTTLGNTDSVEYTNANSGDTSTFQSSYNATPSPVATLPFTPPMNPESVSSPPTSTTISGTAPYNLTNTYTFTLGPATDGGSNAPSVQSTGTTLVVGSSLSLTGFDYLVSNTTTAGNLTTSTTGVPIAGTSVTLSGTDQFGNAVSMTTTTNGSGQYTFSGLNASDANGYTVTETPPTGDTHLGQASTTAGAVTTPASTPVVSKIVLTAANSSSIDDFFETQSVSVNGFDYLVASGTNLTTSTTGTPISGTTVILSGTDNFGNAVTKTTTTNGSGAYSFTGLNPSNASGYTVTETPPAGDTHLGQTSTTAGAVTNMPPGTPSAVSNVVLIANGGSSTDNFFESVNTTGALGKAETGTIGFWNNKNGQALITSVNGGSTATQLGTWLAGVMPNTFGSLKGKTNAQVAAYYQNLFGMSGLQKTYAQVLAVGLAVYATDSSLAGGTMASGYGFLVGAAGKGTGSKTFNVGSNGAAIGVTNNSTLSILTILIDQDKLDIGGVIPDLSDTNSIFNGINQGGDIS